MILLKTKLWTEWRSNFQGCFKNSSVWWRKDSYVTCRKWRSRRSYSMPSSTRKIKSKRRDNSKLPIGMRSFSRSKHKIFHCPWTFSRLADFTWTFQRRRSITTTSTSWAALERHYQIKMISDRSYHHLHHYKNIKIIISVSICIMLFFGIRESLLLNMLKWCFFWSIIWGAILIVTYNTKYAQLITLIPRRSQRNDRKGSHISQGRCM